MKKTIALMIIAAMSVMMLTACGDSKKTEAETAREEITEIAETVKEEETEEIKETKGNTQTAKNLYRTDKEMFPITMGTSVDGKQVPMVKVLVPNSENDLCFTFYRDENYEQQTMKETASIPSLAQIFEGRILEESEHVPSFLEFQGGGSGEYTFYIEPLEKMDYEKTLNEYKDEGSYTEDKYPCLVWDRGWDVDDKAVLGMIQIDEEWKLIMFNSGKIREDFSLDEINKYLCDVVEIIK